MTTDYESPEAKRVAALSAQNERLAQILREARSRIVDLQEQIDSLAKAPGAYGIYLKTNPNGTLDVLNGNRRMHLNASPNVALEDLKYGCEVRLNESLIVTDILANPKPSQLATVKEIIDENRILAVSRADDQIILNLSKDLQDQKVRVGDALNYDDRSFIAYEKIAVAEVQDLILEEIPKVHYEDIGGLETQIEQIKDAVELPFNHPDLYREHGLRAPKGILLYGPPGCGKTLIAKAVANSLASKVTSKNENARSYFLNIKGPELLNKYVGETERHIRLIFSRAREKASQGHPVVVFFDEMESLFRTRGTGQSSDVETTIVPQLLAEIDGVETLDNVIIIGASNREDMIDPAILRPGRLDVKIKIERPNKDSTKAIFAKYLDKNVPLHESVLQQHNHDVLGALQALIEEVSENMYAQIKENQFLEVTYASGDKETLYFHDFNSGAMIQNIVDRAKKSAIKDFLKLGERGITLEHLFAACRDEFRENEDLPNTTNPDDWARIAGKKGERIVFIRKITDFSSGVLGAQSSASTINNTTGQYL